VILTFRTVVAAAGLLCAGGVLAHHSAAAFDVTKEVSIEGTVEVLEWQNPHIYVTIATTGADGKPLLQRVEIGPLSGVQTFGLKREHLAPGSHVTVLANPNRRGLGQTVRGIDVATSDGMVHALVDRGRNSAVPIVVPADGLAGTWSAEPNGSRAFGATVSSGTFTAAGQAARADAQKTIPFLGVCEPYPPPALTVLPGWRSIAVGDKTVVMHFDAEGDDIERIIHLDQSEHPPNVEPSVQGHSIGRMENGALVIDTVAFSRHPLGVTVGVPSGPNKHIVERLALTADRLHLRYELTLEDPDYLAAPVSFAMQWDHRPDLQPSGVPCDPNIARRFLEDAAKP
jgi:hypothetical protein